jgi:ABC-type phosphate/phosphonate transport system substrate-binding protein
LEGCGTVPKGSLRLVGQTAPVPFIEAFVNEQLSQADRQTIKTALGLVSIDKALLAALETHDGFLAVDEKPAEIAKKK